jgi:hypothetical protein
MLYILEYLVHSGCYEVLHEEFSQIMDWDGGYTCGGVGGIYYRYLPQVFTQLTFLMMNVRLHKYGL